MTLITDNLLQRTQASTSSAQMETLAKLYLEGNPTEISDATIAQFCAWL